MYIFYFDGIINESVDIKGQTFKELYKRDSVVVERVCRNHMMNVGGAAIREIQTLGRVVFSSYSNRGKRCISSSRI